MMPSIPHGDLQSHNEDIIMSKHDDDNRSRQLNPEHDAYWQSRGEDGRPDDWEDRLGKQD